MKLIIREIFGYIIIALMLSVIFVACSTIDKRTKEEIYSDTMYEKLQVGNYVNSFIIDALDAKGLIVGSQPYLYGQLIVYPYKDTLRLILIDSLGMIVHKGLEIDGK